MLLLQEQPEAALPKLQQAVALAPYSAKEHFNLARTLLVLGDHMEGLHELHKALTLRPGYGKAHLLIGMLYLNSGKGHDAIAHFLKATQEGEPDADQYIEQAIDMVLEMPIEDVLLRTATLRPPISNAQMLRLAMRVREQLAPDRTPPLDELRSALVDFVQTFSQQEMNQVVRHYPWLGDIQVIYVITKELMFDASFYVGQSYINGDHMVCSGWLRLATLH